MEQNNWFAVSKEGLAELYAGKSKEFAIRELVQNAWDENIKSCIVETNWNNGVAYISVFDDSPEGFKNLTDAYTLFQHTDKRKNAEKRGRYNLGEKQILAISSWARILTTKGEIIFDDKGRHTGTDFMKQGSRIDVKINMTEAEYKEMLDSVKTYLVPKNIRFVVNKEELKYVKPYKTFETSLITEIEQNGLLRRTTRKTKVNLLKTDGKKYLYEMGLPVTEISECEYSIDVQQKIPLGMDRDTIPQAFLKELYAEVLNNTFDEIPAENISAGWIRQATSDKRINKEAVAEVVKKRFGDKVVVANTFDRNSIDEALSRGYNVIFGNELSADEWDNIKKAEAIPSSSELFGTNFVNAKRVTPTKDMTDTGNYARKIAYTILGIEIAVDFVKGGEGMCVAQFDSLSNKLTFNVDKLNGFFDKPISIPTTDLILHELGHYGGKHTEAGYHETLTRLGSELTFLALKNPKFFEVN